jgi:hypothetical protein
MSGAQPMPSDKAVDAAIAAVLAAERDARDSLAQAARTADENEERARARARRLEARTTERIRAVRAAFAARLTLALERMHAEQDAIDSAPGLNDEELAALERALQVLAAELTGGAQ